LSLNSVTEKKKDGGARVLKNGRKFSRTVMWWPTDEAIEVSDAQVALEELMEGDSEPESGISLGSQDSDDEEDEEEEEMDDDEEEDDEELVFFVFYFFFLVVVFLKNTFSSDESS